MGLKRVCMVGQKGDSLQPKWVWDSGLKWCVKSVHLAAEMRPEVCAFGGLKLVHLVAEMGDVFLMIWG